MSPARIAAVAVPVAAAVAAGAILATGGGSGGGGAKAAERPSGPIAAVTRRTLVDRQRVDGTLGYSGKRTVSSALRGTITTLPHAGDVIRPGHALYTVDGDPVVLLDGAIPAFRSLHKGLEGRDVAQLERGLVAMGYDPGAVDGGYDASTVAAVKAWQRDRGLRVTGAVDLGRVVFLPGARRVTDVQAEAGGPSGQGRVMSTTSTSRVVTAKLDAADQSLAAVGRRVRVELPDGRIVSGRISDVGTVATADGGDGGGGDDGGDDTPTVTVTIHLRSHRAAGRLDQAPVSVQIARETRRDVLSVPVQALLARSGGGYAVERADGRLVDVVPGMFADGYVELTGHTVREGERVRVPA